MGEYVCACTTWEGRGGHHNWNIYTATAAVLSAAVAAGMASTTAAIAGVAD